MVFARIRAPYEDVKVAIQEICGKCEKLIVFEHNERSDNIHIHFLMEGNTVSTDTLKNIFKRNGFNGGERGVNWSFVSATDRGCITYMSKGTLEPVFCKGYETEEVSGLKNSWEERRKTAKYQTRLQYVTKETASEAKKRKNDLVQEMILQIENQEQIVKIIIQVLNSNNVIFGRYTVRDYFDTIMSRKFTTTFVDSMNRFCCERL